MTTDVKRYLRALNRCLPCEGEPKKRLMESFRWSLTAFLEETPEPDMLTLHHAFGPPGEMANVLMSSLTAEDLLKSKHSKGRRIVLTVLAAAFAAVVLTVVAFALFSYFQPVTIIETITIHPLGPS